MILKNKVKPNQEDSQLYEKNKILNINKCNKNSQNIFNGVNFTTFSENSSCKNL
jgi:hypothetical protein